MADHGADWYKREPQAYLGGVVGLTARQHAVYSVTLDLIYAQGGRCHNDPKWIAGWFSDLGLAAVRNTISELVARGKLRLEDGFLTNKRARNEAKTREELRKKRGETGKKGGESSCFSDAEINDNNDLDKANASPREEERIEDKIIDGGGTGVPPPGGRRVADLGVAQPLPDTKVLDVTDAAIVRDKVLDAANIDISKCSRPARWLGSESVNEVKRWVALDLTEQEILEVVVDVASRKQDGPAENLNYFTKSMQRLAGIKAAPPLEPIHGGVPNGKSTREQQKDAELARIVARGRDMDRRRAGGG
jgi:hypothetical protein